MKKIVFPILMSLVAVCAQAQWKQWWPDEAGITVFEGDVKNVPDGTVVYLWSPENSDYKGEPVDTIVNGKFSFKKAMNETSRYLLTLADLPDELPIRASGGTTQLITGEGIRCSFWKVKDFEVSESDAYEDYMEKNLPEAYKSLRDKIHETEEKMDKCATVEEMNQYKPQYEELKGKLLGMRDVYPRILFNFMKGRRVSESYCRYLEKYSKHLEKYPELMKEARELCVKVPFSKAGRFSYLFSKTGMSLGVTEKMNNFMLYDHKGKKHNLKELTGKGKNILLEFTCNADKKYTAGRPVKILNLLHDEYSGKVDIVSINCDTKDDWNSNKSPREAWKEWNDYKNSLAVRMRFSPTHRFVLISPQGKILTICDSNDLERSVDKHFNIKNLQSNQMVSQLNQ